MLKRRSGVCVLLAAVAAVAASASVSHGRGLRQKGGGATAAMWLHAWRRLEAERDKNFDYNDRPLLNVTPPPGTGLPSGAAPEAVKDPKLRAQYEAAIKANAGKAEQYTRQYRLQQLDKLFSPKAEEYIVTAYSREPQDPKELKALLETYIADAAVRERILSGAAK